MALLHPEQVDVAGNQYVARPRLLEIFSLDRGRSVLRVPLDARRRQLESIPWVEHATVRRALPNHLQVEVVERTPIAFLRQGSDLALVDAHGVILERPLQARLRFPVVSGVSADMAADDRESRMQLYAGFAQQVDAARPGALDHVSEVDLSDPNDLRATISGPGKAGATPNSASTAWDAAAAPILVHFGDTDFEGKYRTFVENIGQWRAAAGRVDSVDLRFSREAVVNPDTSVVAPQPALPQKAATASVAAPHRAPQPRRAHRRSRHGAKRAAWRDFNGAPGFSPAAFVG